MIHALWWWIVYAPIRVQCWCLFPSLLRNWHKQFATPAHILSFIIMYFHPESFLHIGTTGDDACDRWRCVPHGGQAHVYFAVSIAWLMTPWRWRGQGISSHGIDIIDSPTILRSQYHKGYYLYLGVYSGKLQEYHGHWCPGSLRRQVITTHVIDYARYAGRCFP